MNYFNIAAVSIAGFAAVAAFGAGYVLNALPLLDLENEIDSGEDVCTGVPLARITVYPR